MSISDLPVWRTFGDGEDAGFLVYGDTRSELRMVSLTSGKTLWKRELEKVKSVLPLEGGTLMVVWRRGIQILSADGTVVLDRDSPFKVKTTFDPVVRDMMEAPGAT